MRHRIAFLACICWLLMLAPSADAAAPLPVLVVYPFTVSGTTAPGGIGADLASHIAAEMNAVGGITVISVDAKPEDYRDAARAAGASAYLTGAILQVGSTYSAIEQLVSTRTGIIMGSRTLRFHTLADASDDGRYIHDLLVPSAVHVGSVATAEPHPTNTPTNATLPSPQPSPAASVAAVSASVVVVPLGGPASTEARAFATSEAIAALKRAGISAVATTQTMDPASAGAALCATSAAQMIITGALTISLPTGSAARIAASVDLLVYRCKTHEHDPDLGPSAFAASDESEAIRMAVGNAVLLLPPMRSAVK